MALPHFSSRRILLPRTMRFLVLMSVLLTSFGNAVTDGADVRADEHVVFFTTVAHLDERTNEWVVPIHGWVYEPEDSTVRKAAFAKVLKERYGLFVSDLSRANFDRRVNLLFADNLRGKVVSIRLAGQDYRLKKSAANGHFEDCLRLDAAAVAAHAQDGVLAFDANLRSGDLRRFGGRIHLWEPAGLTVLSDIDDTVKVSGVGDSGKLLEHTFFLDFEAVPGMADLYQAYARQGAEFHFVSSSPWHLYAPLCEFLDSAGFPAASSSLKSIRFKDRTILNLFKKGTVTKPVAIEALLERFPGREFILVGDSGEEDPEVYAGIYQKYPRQIRAICIRNVAGGRSDGAARFEKVFVGVPAGVWHVFSTPEELDVDEQHLVSKSSLESSLR